MDHQEYSDSQERVLRFTCAKHLNRTVSDIFASPAVIIIVGIAFLWALGITKGIICFSVLFSIYFVETALWMRFCVVQIDFNEEHVSIEYYDFNKLKSIKAPYTQFTLEKKNIWYKTKSVIYYLRFQIDKRTVLKRFSSISIDSRMMDVIIGKLSYYKSVAKPRASG